MPAPGIATSNPFAILNSKKAQSKEKEDKKPKAPAPAKNAAEPKKKPETKPVPGKVISLAEVQKGEDEKRIAEKEKKKEEKVEHKAEKVHKALTDRQDRSNKGDRVRKEGNGVGGWDDVTPTAAVEEAEAVAEKAEPKSPVVNEEDKAAAEEAAKQAELEEKQMTYDEWIATKEALDVGKSLNIRTVDSASFANMKRSTKQAGGETFKIGAKAAAAPKKVETVPASKDKVADKVTLKKEGMALSGFRMENPARSRGGRGEGKGTGPRGRGAGRGRGQQQSEGNNAEFNPQIDNEEMFPSLGGRAAAIPAAAEGAQS